MNFTSKLTEKGLLATTKAKVNGMFRESLLQIGIMWHTVFFKKRFDSTAKSLYLLKPRTSAYIRQVTKHYPSWKPLVRTGTMRDMAIAAWRPMATATSAKHVVKVKMASAHPRQRYVSNELRRTTPNEVKELQNVFKQQFLNRVDKIPPKVS